MGISIVCVCGYVGSQWPFSPNQEHDFLGCWGRLSAEQDVEQVETGGVGAEELSQEERMNGMDEHTAYCIDSELTFARHKFPGTRYQLPALMEEVGDLAQAMIAHSLGNQKGAQVYAEAIQVACMAIRIAEEGDEAFPYRFEYEHYRDFDTHSRELFKAVAAPPAVAAAEPSGAPKAAGGPQMKAPTRPPRLRNLGELLTAARSRWGKTHHEVLAVLGLIQKQSSILYDKTFDLYEAWAKLEKEWAA